MCVNCCVVKKTARCAVSSADARAAGAFIAHDERQRRRARVLANSKGLSQAQTGSAACVVADVWPIFSQCKCTGCHVSLNPTPDWQDDGMVRPNFSSARMLLERPKLAGCNAQAAGSHSGSERGEVKSDTWSDESSAGGANEWRLSLMDQRMNAWIRVIGAIGVKMLDA